MKLEELEAIADGIVPAVKEYVDAAVGALDRRLFALENKVGEGLEYFGVHEHAKSYRVNAAVTYDGSIWISRRETTQRPGDGNDWQLAVKRGKDGR
jgi:hypothetical protein